MIYLLDTNVLLRLIEKTHEQHEHAEAAVLNLRRQNCSFVTFLQNISEFWNVCTRPMENNGLGLPISYTYQQLENIEKAVTVLEDNADVYPNFRRLVVEHSVVGVKVHDAKIVAAMMAHGIENLLTFDVKDFRRFHEITAVSPADI